jgi:uncharacterized protein
MSFKVSKYVHYSDPVGIKKHRIIYSARTGRSKLISNSIYSFLIHSLDKLDSEIMNELQEMEVVVQREEDEYNEILKKYSIINKNKDSLNYVIHPFSGCQLRCHYCGQSHFKNRLTDKDIPKIISRIQHKLNKSKRKNLHITWFGGEPLLGIDFIEKFTPIVQDLCLQYDIKYSARMVTNGQLLTKKVYTKLKKLCVNQYEITLDGPKHIHDKRRITEKGKGSYDDIIRNLRDIFGNSTQKFKDAKFNIRSNIDKYNQDHIMELTYDLEDNNILKNLNTFYIAPVYSWGNDADKNSLTPEAFAKIQISFYLRLIKMGYPQGIIPNNSSLWSCMIHSNNNEVIDANGKISCCTEVSYVQAYKDSEYFISNINNKPRSLTYDKILEPYFDKIKDTSNECSKCDIFPICGGGCARKLTEGIYTCPPFKLNLKERLLLTFYENKADYIKI